MLSLIFSSGGTPSCKLLTTKTGVGKYTMLVKRTDGIVEEWKLAFTDWGLVMVRP